MRALVRTLAFLALAAFSALEWTTLVADPPMGRTLLVVAVVTAAGAAIASVPWSSRRPRTAAVARLLVLAIAGLVAVLAIGLPARLVAPAGWSDLHHGITRGLVALRISDWPYKGSDAWVRLTVLLVMPVVLAAAAALAFWPARRARSALRIAAVALLVGLYAVASVQHQPQTPMFSGTLLLALLAAWLFLPEVARGRALGASAMVLAAGGVSLPLATVLPATDPVVNYRALTFGAQHRFTWDQTYGPIDWPRDRDIVLTVDSVEPHYWKALTLDRFDGDRWISSEGDPGALPLAELPAAASSKWHTEVTVTVASVQSTLLFAPGPVLGTQGLDAVSVGSDGTAWTSDNLGPGDSYTIHAYAPDPSAARMRRASGHVPRKVRRYTRFELPGGVPESGVLNSPYARTYRLAHRLARPAPTTYDAVRRIEEYLRSSYQYGETPPERTHPLAAFLFRDRVGYCQQFSGAMALMLRMDGIPARVAAGFAPGEGDGTSWVVRDLDAHSWVEVYFRGVGWIPFDPTPPAAPAGSLSTSGVSVSAARGNQGRIAPLIGLGDLGRVGGFVGRHDVRPTALIPPGQAGALGGDLASADAGSTATSIPLAPIATGLAALACALAALGVHRWLRRNAAAGELGELRSAMALFGRPLAPGATLAQLEWQLTERASPLAARHVGLLRRRRYGPTPIPPLDPRARRAFRRAVSAGNGPLGLLRGYVALPPRRRDRL